MLLYLQRSVRTCARSTAAQQWQLRRSAGALGCTVFTSRNEPHTGIRGRLTPRWRGGGVHALGKKTAQPCHLRLHEARPTALPAAITRTVAAPPSMATPSFRRISGEWVEPPLASFDGPGTDYCTGAPAAGGPDAEEGCARTHASHAVRLRSCTHTGYCIGSNSNG